MFSEYLMTSAPQHVLSVWLGKLERSSDHCVLCYRRLFSVKKMPVSLKDVLNKAVQMHCIKSWLSSTCPFNIMCEETGSMQEALLDAGVGRLSPGKHLCGCSSSRVNQPPFFFHQTSLLLEWLTNYGYSDLGILRLYSQKWTKGWTNEWMSSWGKLLNATTVANDEILAFKHEPAF